MSRFYETTVLVDGPLDVHRRPSGIQVLASPATVEGEEVDYQPLYRMIVEQSPLLPLAVTSRDFPLALAALANPGWNSRWERLGEFADQRFATGDLDLAVGQYLYSDAAIAAEASPLQSNSVARLAGDASVIVFLIISGSPAIVILGGTAGLVVLRGLGAVGGALWRGAEPNVEHVGAEVSAKLINALCKRLNLKPLPKDPGSTSD